MQYENGPTPPVKYHTLTQYAREVTASDVALRPVRLRLESSELRSGSDHNKSVASIIVAWSKTAAGGHKPVSVLRGSTAILVLIGALKNFFLFTHPHVSKRSPNASSHHQSKLKNDPQCCARGRPIIVEWERDARHSAGLSLVRWFRRGLRTALTPNSHISLVVVASPRATAVTQTISKDQ
ncbi:hypothetical protein EVAR_36791_1 [Eumeta japonica]|uniref:Uncharacterized protein n=1 Tax=Eumeta variegata TaxID=151549 RepID=A0A4C1WYN2_EUMVA|nr:hypothetical protein EVAR_36791_1 [Eumeta japonica]